VFVDGYPVCDLVFITSQSKERVFVLKLNVWVSRLIRSLRFVTFRKEGVITERKNISGKIWLFQNYCWTIYSMFLRTFSAKMTILWEKQKLCHEKKIQWKWNKLLGKWQYFRYGGNHVGKRTQNAKFRTFYWKSRDETNSIWPNKNVIINWTFFGDNFFEMLCKETNLYCVQNKGKYASISKGLNGWMSVWQNWGKKLQ
jgi:hypothetical protein